VCVCVCVSVQIPLLFKFGTKPNPLESTEMSRHSVAFSDLQLTTTVSTNIAFTQNGMVGATQMLLYGPGIVFF
jgi:hypothetical protein